MNRQRRRLFAICVCSKMLQRPCVFLDGAIISLLLATINVTFDCGAHGAEQRSDLIWPSQQHMACIAAKSMSSGATRPPT